MNTQTQAQPNQKPATELVEHRRIAGLVLERASRFNHSDSVNVSNGISIVGARMLGTDWRPAKDDERPDGFGLSQRVTDPQSRKTYVKRGFVPLSGVLEVMFGE